jgi:hypothetical protein
VHAWARGTNQTLCGRALSRSWLGRYPHVDWEDIRPESGRHADAVRRVCPRWPGPARGENRRSGAAEAPATTSELSRAVAVDEWCTIRLALDPDRADA